MAQAADQHTTPREWTLAEYHRFVRITRRCGINDALREMERRIVTGQLLLIRRDYDADDNLKGGAVKIDRFYFLRNYTLEFVQLNGYDWVRVVTRRPDTASFVPGGITTTKFVESELVRTGPGREIDGWYTVVEQATSPRKVTSPRKTKPIAPAKKEKRETQHTRIIVLMKELHLETGMRPRDVRKAVEPAYRKKHRAAAPSPSATTRAYDEYESALTEATKPSN